MSLVKDRALERVAYIEADWAEFIDELPDVGNQTKQASDLARSYFKGQYRFDRTELTDRQRHIGDELCRLIGARVWSINKISPGSMTLPHRDGFTPTAKTLGEWEAYQQGEWDPHERYVRYWIPINDRSLGQWFEAESVRTLCDWRAGDVFVSPSAYTHCGATVGTDPRYLIMADGLQSDESVLHHNFTTLRIE